MNERSDVEERDDQPTEALDGGHDGGYDSSDEALPDLSVADAAAGELPPPKRLGRQANLLVALVAVVAILTLFWPRGDGSFAAPGGFLTDGNGRPQTLGTRMAPVTLVHFWATWCPPCITEIPTLDDLTNDFRAEYNDFQVLMIAVQDDVEKVDTFLGNSPGIVLYDHNWDVAHRYGTRKLPETYLVVRGRVVQRWEGAQNWNDPEIRKIVEDALTGQGDGGEA